MPEGGRGAGGGQSNSEFSYVITLPLSPAEVQKVYKRERERGMGGRRRRPTEESYVSEGLPAGAGNWFTERMSKHFLIIAFLPANRFAT